MQLFINKIVKVESTGIIISDYDLLNHVVTTNNADHLIPPERYNSEIFTAAFQQISMMAAVAFANSAVDRLIFSSDDTTYTVIVFNSDEHATGFVNGLHNSTTPDYFTLHRDKFAKLLGVSIQFRRASVDNNIPLDFQSIQNAFNYGYNFEYS